MMPNAPELSRSPTRGVIHVAKAAETLGLHTLPLDTVQTCLDKYATRLLCPGFSQSLRVKNLADLRVHLETDGLPFVCPLIVKPCTDWGCQGVYKARNEDELLDAVSPAGRAAKVFDLFIDTYAKFVLQDGEILFVEVVDGFPCTAEMGVQGKPGGFLETDQLWPSNHPRDEQDLVRSTLHSILLRLGIRDGVFHLEARIQGSAMEYTPQDGLVDLRPRDKPHVSETGAFLLEINERPPGHGGSWGAALAYGLDYPALQCALGERSRLRALAQPFAQGACHWVDTIFINPEAGGVYNGGDLCLELHEKRPNLIAHVYYCNTYYKEGETATDSPTRIALRGASVVSSSWASTKCEYLFKAGLEMLKVQCDS